MTWTVSSFDAAEQFASVAACDSWPALSSQDVAQHGPDVSLVARRDARVGARCSLWWNESPRLDGHAVGAIGHYAASDDDAASTLLDRACRVLAQRGCRMAVGPMDGNTWRRYRLVVEQGAEPAFLFEPANPPSWVTHFQAAGFSPLAHYTSAVNVNLLARDPRRRELELRFAERGVVWRTLRMEEYEDELQRIYRVSEQAFAENFLYTPIPFAQFAAQYRVGADRLEPALVLVAEQNGEPVGFCFSVPDFLEQARTGERRTAILKTVAVLPDRTRFGGLGSLLIDVSHERAAQLGFSRVIHALMHESNQSRHISGRTAAMIRRYAIFARPLLAIGR